MVATTTIIAILMAASGCSDIEAGAAWAPQAASRSTPGQSFAWAAEADPKLNDLQELDPSLRDLIRTTVQEELAVKGYTKASHQQADFWLRCRLASASRGDAYSDEFQEYTEGTLIIYVLDPQSGKWIWRGWATARLNDANSPEKKRQRLRQAVQMMLKDVPPHRSPRAG